MVEGDIDMKKILLFTAVCFSLGVGISFAASPTYVVETLPASNELDPVVVGSTGSTSAVTVSSSVITRVDTAFNAAALSSLGATYKRAEISIQNNDTTVKYCGFSSSALTITNSYKINVDAVWSFKLGKGMGVYCLNAAGSSGTLIVGGVAWK
jgi:hypothetical protein